jgi:hypothetical protein
LRSAHRRTRCVSFPHSHGLTSILTISRGQPQTDIAFFRYLAELILSLPYTFADEVLSIIYYINRSVSFVGGTALAALETFFKKSKADSTNLSAEAAEDKLKISSMIMVLLVLKHTLKRAYKLTDRCVRMPNAVITRLTCPLVTDPPTSPRLQSVQGVLAHGDGQGARGQDHRGPGDRIHS